MLTQDAKNQKKSIIDVADMEETAIQARIDLEDLKFQELRRLAKANGIYTPRQITKAGLIALLRERVMRDGCCNLRSGNAV